MFALQFVGIIAAFWSNWVIALVGIVAIVTVAAADPLGYKMTAYVITAVAGTWGFWMFPYLQPIGYALAVITGSFFVWQCIVTLTKNKV
ncbi:MAG: hypothetical protein ABR884_02180 [Minisyncoccia bacterium]